MRHVFLRASWGCLLLHYIELPFFLYKALILLNSIEQTEIFNSRGGSRTGCCLTCGPSSAACLGSGLGDRPQRRVCSLQPRQVHLAEEEGL